MAKRTLNSLERFYYYRGELNVLSSIFVAVQLNKLPTKEQLFQTLKKLIEEYPQLHCNIFKDETNGELIIKSIEKRPIEFDDVVEYVSSRDDDEGINDIFKNYQFPYHVEKPLWKILIDRDKRRQTLVVNHVLFDGISCVKFWESFFMTLNDLSAEEGDNNEALFSPQVDVNTVPVVHPYENWPVTWKYVILRPLLATIFKWSPSALLRLNPNLFQFKSYIFPSGLLESKKDNMKTGFQIRNDNCQFILKLSSVKLKRVLRECKSNKVSLTSFLASLICLTLKNTSKSDDYKGSILKVDIPMNTRKALGDRFNDLDSKTLQLGNLVASLQIEKDMNDLDDIWAAAKDFQHGLKLQSVDNINETINNTKLLDVVDEADFVIEKLKTNGPPGTFEITNLGFQSFCLKENPDAEFIVEDSIFNEPQSTASIFTCAVVSTQLGGLTCSISYPREIKSQFQPFVDSISNYFSTRED